MLEEPHAERLLHIIDENCKLYIRHRELGDYDEAVKRLQHAAKWADVVDQAERDGHMQLSPDDWSQVQLVRRHVQAMNGILPDHSAS